MPRQDRGRWSVWWSRDLPLRGTRGRLLGVGSVASCVAIEGPAPTYVVKFWRQSLGMPMDELMKVARELRDEQRALRRWYEDVPDLLVPTVYVVLEAPRHRVPAAAAVQQQVVEPAADLLQDHTDEELVGLLERNEGLRHAFVRFTECTRRAWDEDRRVLDMVGRNNVLLVRTSRGPVLRVIDFGVWDVDRQLRETPVRYVRARRALERLERITDRVR